MKCFREKFKGIKERSPVKYGREFTGRTRCHTFPIAKKTLVVINELCPAHLKRNQSGLIENDTFCLTATSEPFSQTLNATAHDPDRTWTQALNNCECRFEIAP